jgi:WD40 repeat protein
MDFMRPGPGIARRHHVSNGYLDSWVGIRRTYHVDLPKWEQEKFDLLAESHIAINFDRSLANHLFKAFQERAWHIAWNPAKPLLASCSADKSVRLYHYRPSTNTEDSQRVDFSHVTTIHTGPTKTVRAIAMGRGGGGF